MYVRALAIWLELKALLNCLVPALLVGCAAQQEPQVLPPNLPDRFVNSAGVEMQFVPAGSFTMGSDRKFRAGRQEIAFFAPAHEVSLDAFYMARFELTVGQFKEFANETGYAETDPSFNPAAWKKGAHYIRDEAYPILSLDWYTANEFCDWLSAQEGRDYRLPTEAEWEYACRAGTTTEVWHGDEGSSFIEACFPREGSGYPAIAPPGAYQANPWGFYDMAGNAPEWVLDWWSKRYDRWDVRHNPDGPWWGDWLGKWKVRRGGMNQAPIVGSCASYFRKPALPSHRYGAIRLVCPIDESFVVPELAPLPTIDPPAEFVEPGRVYETWELAHGVELKMVWIPPGKFVLGSKEGDAGGRASPNEMPRVPVIYTEGFYMGVYELTQAQYKAVVGVNPSQLKGGNLPVHNISMHDLFQLKFKEKLLKTVQENNEDFPEGAIFDLPQEFEWEYACRAGSQAAYFFGDDVSLLPSYAWFDGLQGPHLVGQKLPNRWGLYDMHGNIVERTNGYIQGAYDVNLIRHNTLFPILNPKLHNAGNGSPLRGGGWNYSAYGCRSAARHGANYSEGTSLMGFRIVRRLGEDEVPPTPSIDVSTTKRYKPDEFPWDEFLKEIHSNNSRPK